MLLDLAGGEDARRVSLLARPKPSKFVNGGCHRGVIDANQSRMIALMYFAPEFTYAERPPFYPFKGYA
jgi:hypothetical protein